MQSFAYWPEQAVQFIFELPVTLEALMPMCHLHQYRIQITEKYCCGYVFDVTCYFYNVRYQIDSEVHF